MGLYKRKITVEDRAITSAIHLTLRQSLFQTHWVCWTLLALGSRCSAPKADLRCFFLVPILFFPLGFAYGLLNILNSHFQTTLNISATESSGLQASYFAAYFICPLIIYGWIVP